MSIDTVNVTDITIGRGHPLAVIAGPCVIESRDHTLSLADQVACISRHVETPCIFKASFDKANRSSAAGFRGPGLDDGLRILEEVSREIGLPVLSDIHTADQAKPAGQVLDVVQIPAFLCRQTDLLLAAGQTGRCVNIKKGQFMAPEEMANAVDKVRGTGNDRVLLTERGTFFGYHRLVNDMTSIARMQRCCPAVFDATHSCQQPGAAGDRSGGQREFVPTLALAAVAAGADALFLEVHDDPDHAQSDPATVYPIDKLGDLLTRCRRVAEAATIADTAREDYAARLARIKQRYPRAYERWTEEEDDRLRVAGETGRPIAEIAELFQRQPSAIRSRFAKLGLWDEPA